MHWVQSQARYVRWPLLCHTAGRVCGTEQMSGRTASELDASGCTRAALPMYSRRVVRCVELFAASIDTCKEHVDLRRLVGRVATQASATAVRGVLFMLFEACVGAGH